MATGMTTGTPAEEVIWDGHPSWRAWAGDWIWGWVLLPVVIGAFFLFAVWMRTRSNRWKVTSRRIEIEKGFFSKRIDTLELWRVRDVEYRQSLLDRMFGVARFWVTANDAGVPAMEIRGVPGDRATYDRLMVAVMEGRKQRGVVNLNA